MRVPKPPKSTLGRMMEEEELLSKAAGCPPGHTYNKNIKKCLPGSPLSGIGSVYSTPTPRAKVQGIVADAQATVRHNEFMKRYRQQKPPQESFAKFQQSQAAAPKSAPKQPSKQAKAAVAIAKESASRKSA